MLQIVLRAATALALMALGWTAAKAQAPSPPPAFEIVVDAPAGQTSIECVRGCALTWVERGVSPNTIATKTFSFSCGGGSMQRCSSGKIGGWIR